MTQGQAAETGPTTAELPPPPKPKSRKVWRWVLAILLGWLVVSVLVRLADLRTEPSGPERALGASESLSSHDLEVINGLGTHMQRFNAASLPLISEYLDPTVSIQKWVRTAGNHISEMRSATLAMEADILSVQDNGIRNTLEAFPRVLREQVAAVTELRLAVAHLDVGGETAALRHLRRASNERQQLGAELLDRLRPFVDPETLQRIAQAAAEGLET